MCESNGITVWLENEQQTRQAGAVLFRQLKPLAATGPVVLFVRGNLGAGKSTFVRGFLAAAGVTGVMPSPTYSLVEPYEVEGLSFYHMDAYRLADAAELDYLGLDDLYKPHSFALIEWPDHLRDALPPPQVMVNLAMAQAPDGSESLEVSPGSESALDSHSADSSEIESPQDSHSALDSHSVDSSEVESPLDSHSALRHSVVPTDEDAGATQARSRVIADKEVNKKNLEDVTGQSGQYRSEGSSERVSVDQWGRRLQLVFQGLSTDTQSSILEASNWSEFRQVLT